MTALRLLLFTALICCLAAFSAFRPSATNVVVPGAYNDYASGFEAPMETFEAWLGYSTDALHSIAYSPYAFDCVGGGTACMTNSGNFYNGSNYWWPTARQKVTWSLALTGCDHAVNLSGSTQCTSGHTIPLTGTNSIASGFEDAVFNSVIGDIGTAWPNAVIRLGWEMNLSSWTWGNGGSGGETGSGTAYIAAFQHVAGLIHAYNSANGTHLLIDWCPNFGEQQSTPTTNFYPGDSYVDIVGLDFYDFAGSSFAAYQADAYGLNWQAAFAVQHSKTMAYDEWGCGGTLSTDANCAAIIQGMAVWMRANPILYFDFWNSQSATNISKQICNNGTAGVCGSPYQNPLSAAAFCAAFKGTSGPACGTTMAWTAQGNIVVLESTTFGFDAGIGSIDGTSATAGTLTSGSNAFWGSSGTTYFRDAPGSTSNVTFSTYASALSDDTSTITSGSPAAPSGCTGDGTYGVGCVGSGI